MVRIVCLLLLLRLLLPIRRRCQQDQHCPRVRELETENANNEDLICTVEKNAVGVEVHRLLVGLQHHPRRRHGHQETAAIRDIRIRDPAHLGIDGNLQGDLKVDLVRHLHRLALVSAVVRFLVRRLLRRRGHLRHRVRVRLLLLDIVDLIVTIMITTEVVGIKNDAPRAYPRQEKEDDEILHVHARVRILLPFEETADIVMTMTMTEILTAIDTLHLLLATETVNDDYHLPHPLSLLLHDLSDPDRVLPQTQKAGDRESSAPPIPTPNHVVALTPPA